MSDEMSSFDAYQSFLAITRHFKEGAYDYFKYNGKISASHSSFMARKDKYLFEKALKKYSRKDEWIKFLVASTVDGNRQGWIGDLLCPYHDIVYKKWRKRTESLTYNFKEELTKIHSKEENFNNLFVIEDGKHPYAFRLFQRGIVSLETLVLLDDLVHFTKHWSKQDDIILNDTVSLIKKYRPFLYHFTNADNSKLKQIILEIYS
jgi:hypothetical protein